MTDDAGQPHRAEIAQRHTEAAAEHAEDRILGRHPQVAPECELDAAGNRIPFDGGDHRLGQCQARRPHRSGTVVGDGPAVTLGHGLQVGARAERAARPR